MDAVGRHPIDAGEFYERLRSWLLGRNISFVRLACDTLLIYVECEPGDGQGVTIWFDPVWHVATPERVLADSRQARGQDDEGPTEAELDRVSEPICEMVIGRPITDVQVDSHSRDLTVTVADGCFIRTSASDPVDDSWHIRENTTELTLQASPARWWVRD